MENEYNSYNNQEEKSSGGEGVFREFAETANTDSNSPSTEITSSNSVSNNEGIDISSSCVQIPASDVVSFGYEFSESDLIPQEIKSGSFFESGSLIEFFVYDSQKNLISQDYNFTNYSITNNTATIDVPTTFTNQDGNQEIVDDTSPIPTNEITVNPTFDLFDRGFDNGQVFAYYNFINYELNSSTEKTYYISEISGDRTEIRLKSIAVSARDMLDGYNSLKSRLDNSRDFDEFYLSLYGNNNVVGINILFEENPVKELDPSILVKLFQPLPQPYKVEDRLYITTKVGESIAYRVEFFPDFEAFIDNANFIKGPNVNIPLNDLINNSTTLQSYDTLTNTPSSESLGSVLNYLNKTGVTITPNYSYNTFNEFVNFSSAKQRITNFYEKVSQIQSYQSDIDVLTATTSSNPGVIEISQSLASLQTNILNLVENFDGYENFLYYNSSSFAYPKTGSEYPYTLFPTSSLEVDTWLGSDVENSQYYGGIKLSASLYDEDNQNWLYYTIPSFITENSDNDRYVEFSNMVGQSFDEVWLYTRALSERYNTTNDPETGLPLDLAAEAIKGLGFETFGNNYDNQDNFIGLTGEDNGIYVPPTGSELITDYIAINNGKIINYWNLGYSWLDYVEQLNDPGFPYAIDKVSKEIYKRLYHNMAYLTKKKGTISGLRQLINIWGIPNTILRINEFGGKNKDNSDDYDLWYKRYSYAYTPVANQYMASSSVKVPWMPLQRNYIADNNEYIVPDGIAFRFKTTGHPSSSYGGKFYSQSLAVKKSNGTNDQQMDWGVGLFYEDQPSGSYSGSSFSDYYNYGKLRFYMSASTSDGGVQISDDIFLPFFDGGWWSVLLQRDQHVSASDNNTPTTYTLFAANKQVDGWDGNSLGWSGSVSMSSTDTSFNSGYGGGTYDGIEYDVNASVYPSINQSWNDFGVTEHDGVYVGGYVSGSNVMTEILNEGAKIFSGSFQEFRYYSNNISKEVFNDFVMNPESVEGNKITGSESSFDIVNFRAPLGNELEYLFTSSVSESFSTLISSSHPSITGSAPIVFTQSFINPTDSSLTSSYEFIGYEAASTYTYSKPNVETYFLDQPAIGIRNRISNKIQVDDNSDYGTVLSKYRSIDQNYLISRSYTEDITSLEVGFSPQDEVNDDIIATYGYGVISDVLGDPRFAYEGKENYYPKLRNIANDYFKKYTEGDVWDYLRLIKYFDNSLFKAIKSYVPARTSVTTGIIVKQHMLERNRRVPVTVNPNTIIAYTPETGSVVGGHSTATGMNSPISYRDLELTGSIKVATIEGSTGGVPNPYNVEATQSAFLEYYSQTSPGNIPGQYINLLGSGGITSVLKNISKTPPSVTTGIRLAAPLKTRFKFYNSNDIGFLSPDTGFEFAVSSSVRGIIGTDTIMSSSLTPINTEFISSFYEMLPEEDISFWVRGVDISGTPTSTQISFLFLQLNWYDDFTILNTQPIPYSSSVANSYVTQSYIVRNDTISGSTYEIHKSQDEFYNGEYSGSTITATTQSLLYNPFAPSQTLNTNYVINVSASSGRYSATFGTPINTFPSFSLYTDVYAYQSGVFNPDQIDDDILNYETVILPNLTLPERNSRAAIFIRQSSVDARNFFIEAIFLPVLATADPYLPITDPVVDSFELSTLFGIGDFGKGTPVPITPIPLPPISASGMDGGLYTSVGNTPAFEFNNIGPYFKLNFSGSDIFQAGATVGASVTPINFSPNGLAANLDSNILVSPLLGSRESIEVSTPLINNRSVIKYKFNDGSINGQRPIRLNGTPDQSTSQSWNNTTQVTMSLFVSNYDTVISSQNVITQFGNGPGWLSQQQNDNGGNFIGSGSLLVQGTTWTGSFGDSGYWSPYGLLLNEKNYDENGNIVNNTATILNPEVDFDFEITDFIGGNATTIDEYGFFGGEFKQGLVNVEGIITQDYTNTLKNSIGFLFNPATSRQLSGMYQGGFGGLYQPTGSQNTQYINFNPQLPPFSDFYNTPYNVLINNVTGSVFNTYKQIVEYNDGPIPSNLIPIISGSARKAEIPDSFYTQKSSILPRFEGSKLQSATYNSFTNSGSQIQYLNGDLTGSLISGSDQILQEVVATCFIAGTQISLMDGSTKNIEDINTEDKILTYNENSKENEEGIIGHLQKHQSNSQIILEFSNKVNIITTNEHPFYVKSKGWVKASNLKVQDICQNVEGKDVTITSIINGFKSVEVFNLIDVTNNHNYYANGILVHNKAPGVAISDVAISPTYEGDSRPGSMPSLTTQVGTVAKHPIYFAHFKTSKPTNELWGSYTFRIDQLIECPLDNISGREAPINPKVIKIDGSNNNITDVRSTFEVDRKALVAYNQGKVAKSGSAPINYTSLNVGENLIYQGAMEYQTIMTNQVTERAFAKTQSFITSSWADARAVDASGQLLDPQNSYQLGNYQVKIATLPFYPSASAFSMLTSSTDSSLYLMGSAMVISSSIGISGSGVSAQMGSSLVVSGRGLALVNSYNQYVSRSIYATASLNAPGIPNNIKDTGLTSDVIQLTKKSFIDNPTSYITQDFKSTTRTFGATDKNCTEFEDFQQPILFQVGDEIRIEYNSIDVNDKLGESLTQTFTITGNGPNFQYENGVFPDDGQDPPEPMYGLASGSFGGPGFAMVTKGNHVYDKIMVSPDPRSLETPIPKGHIFGFTLRRRIEADDRVVIYQNAPTGSEGVKTLSPSGYLIPDDFSQQQKRNVQTIVNQLSVKNTFRADEDNDTKRMPTD